MQRRQTNVQSSLRESSGDGIEALRQYRTAYDERVKTFAITPHRDWTTDIAREIAPPPPPKSEQPPGRPLNRLTMDEYMDLDQDKPSRRDRI
jgi:hypothetical protein